MKRIIAAAILLCLIIGLSVTNTVFIENSYEKLQAGINDLKESYSTDEKSVFKEKCEKFEKEWTDLEEKLFIFVNREVTLKIGVSVSKLAAYSETADDMFLAECREIEVELLNMIKDAKLSLQSVF